MRNDKVSITLWGNGTEIEKWDEWNEDIKQLADNLGHRITHIGIMSAKYNNGKLVTVSRKEKEVLSSISKGEKPSSFSHYSLPSNYQVAAFDYDFLAERCNHYITLVFNYSDYNSVKEEQVVSMMKKYIREETGEIYYTEAEDMPLGYALTKNVENAKSHKLIRNI